ncbi:hypothetical protein EYM_07665 [Ignicoccus islandicus DSM 13165]|uniref:Uncharacterized protein n=1 Tax=Ignicoccus islandicus DSM 13165 TaxID=940295 RepID=A0A0U2WPC2_9CREN|nr:hypothetical protein [Ignicoccus islandicus]ALU12801.1 hypothetical protein EYM_07665 [Ignicoccus islandicus DSM 13165]
MPFISSGKTIGFKRVSPQEYSLLDLIEELSSENFVGRISVDGVLDGSPITIYVEILRNVIIGLEVIYKGRTLRGSEAVDIFQRALVSVEGVAEIIQLDEEKIEVDLRDNPEARVSMPIPSRKSLTFKPSYVHFAAKKSIEKITDFLYMTTRDTCIYIEGLLSGDACNIVLKGDICPDLTRVQMGFGKNEIEVTSLTELSDRLKKLKDKCQLLEIYGSKIA